MSNLAKLQRQWYARLRDDGFDDVEYGREDGPLKVACRENRGIDTLEYEATLEYFSRASEFLETRHWTTATEREVWRRHADGASLREIAAAMGRSKKWAERRVSELRAEMTAWWSAAREESIQRPAGRRQRRRRRRSVRLGVQLALWELPEPLVQE